MIRVLQGQVFLLQQQVSILQDHSRELYDRVIVLQEWKDKFLARPWGKQ